MSDTNGNGTNRILSLDQALPLKKKGGNKESPVSREQAMRDAQEIAIKVVEWHMQQIPGLLTGMINGALVAYGLVELTPTKKGEAGGTSDPATTDPATGANSSEPTAQIPSAEPEGDTSTANSIEWPDSVRAALNEPIPEIVAIRDSTEPVSGSVHVVAHDFPVGVERDAISGDVPPSEPTA